MLHINGSSAAARGSSVAAGGSSIPGPEEGCCGVGSIAAYFRLAITGK
jgi:hypothetical protein